MRLANGGKAVRHHQEYSRMKKRVLIIVLVVLTLFIGFIPDVAYADVIDDLEQEVSDGLDNIDFSEVDDIASDYFGSVADKVQSIINGEFDGAETFFQLLTTIFAEGLRSIIPQLSAIFVVMVILGLLRKTSGGIISDSTNEVVSFVGVTVVLLSILSMIVEAYRQTYQLLYQVSALTEVSTPILLTLLIANGGTATSGVCQPSMVMFSSVVIKTVQNVVLPLAVFALIFSLISNISSNIRVGKMSSFLTGASTWLLGVLFMVYTAFTSVQGISAMTLDGVSYRAAKFATKSYIPILGGYLADGFDMVVASTSLIKNAFGAVTLLILLFALSKPLIYILCVNLGLQCVAAVTEPIVEDRYVKMLNGISKNMTFLSVIMLAVAFMFGILALIVISCSNGA